MIARHWHGRVPATLVKDYLKLMKEVALPITAVPGNLSAIACTAPRRHRPCRDVTLGGRGRDPALPGEDMTVAKYTISTRFPARAGDVVRHYKVIEG